MRKAAQRALNEGKGLRDGATPISGEELTMIEPLPGKRHKIIVWWYSGMETQHLRWTMAYIGSAGRTATDRWPDSIPYL